MKKKECPCCFEFGNNCCCGGKQSCPSCGEMLCEREMYEYRGALGCCNCIDNIRKTRDWERHEIIEEENHKTAFAKGVDLSNSTRGKINKKILKQNIDIAGKESYRMKKYEGRIE